MSLNYETHTMSNRKSNKNTVNLPKKEDAQKGHPLLTVIGTYHYCSNVFVLFLISRFQVNCNVNKAIKAIRPVKSDIRSG